jgi:hypothetical protein
MKKNPLIQLSDHFQAISAQLLDIFADDRDNQQQVRDLSAKLARDAASGTLRIVVFGQYNAGKSTLINALLGEERAPVLDVPATSRITDYPWEGHLLSDSPGIDAPIEHEELTDEFIREECHAVVFVVPTGGSIEEGRTWNRLCDLLAQKRSTIVVINDKGGHTLHGPEYLQAQHAVFANLQQAAERRGLKDVLGGLQVLHVKAKLAVKGKVEGKPALVAASGIAEAEAALLHFLQGATAKIFASNRDRVLLLLHEAQRTLASRAAGTRASVLVACKKTVQEQQSLLEKNLREVLSRLVDKEVKDLQGEIEKMGGPASDIAALLSNAVERSQRRLYLAVDEQFGLEVERSAEAVAQSTAAAGLALDLASGDVPEVELKGGGIPKGARPGTAAKGQSKAGGAVMESLKALPTEKWANKGADALLHKGKEWFPKLFKGIGDKTIGKWATRAGKAVGPALVLATAAYELWSAGASDREARLEHERFVGTVMSDVRSTFALAQDEYSGALSKEVRAIFAPLLASIDSRIAEAAAVNSVVAKQLHELTAWEQQL